MTAQYLRCRACDHQAFWRVSARVPARATSRLGNLSFSAACCAAHLDVTVTAAMEKTHYTAPAKVSIEKPAEPRDDAPFGHCDRCRRPLPHTGPEMAACPQPPRPVLRDVPRLPATAALDG